MEKKEKKKIFYVSFKNILKYKEEKEKIFYVNCKNILTSHKKYGKKKKNILYKF